MFADRVPMMLAPSGRVTAAIDILLKDQTLVDPLGIWVGARTPIARRARDLLAEAASEGLGALNDCEVVRRFRL